MGGEKSRPQLKGGLKNQDQIWLPTTPTSLCLRPKGSFKQQVCPRRGEGVFRKRTIHTQLEIYLIQKANKGEGSLEVDKFEQDWILFQQRVGVGVLSFTKIDHKIEVVSLRFGYFLFSIAFDYAFSYTYLWIISKILPKLPLQVKQGQGEQ